MTGSPNLTWNRRQNLKAHPEEPDAPLCSKCGLANDRAPQRYCGFCHTLYQRSWRRGEIEPRDVSRATNVSCDPCDNEQYSRGESIVKPATEANMRDIKAALAAKFADAAGRDAELSCVCEMLEVDEDAARNLIAQGRRLLRLKREGVGS